MLRGMDYHIHTEYLGCADKTMKVEAIYRRCEELGIRSIGITDHLNRRESVVQHFKIREDIERIPTELEVFFGVEINLLNVDGEIPYDEKMRDEVGFQFAIGGIHSCYVDSYDIDEIVRIQHHHHCRFASDPLIDVLVHPWWFSQNEFRRKGFPWFDDLSVVPEEYHLELAEVAREHGTAIEVNACAIFCTRNYSDRFKEQYKEYIALLKDQGVMFSISSDAHNINHLGTTRVVEDILAEIGVPDSQIWNPKMGKTWKAKFGTSS